MDPVVANAKAIIEQGSKSFAAAAKLFDTETREKAFMLYAWCRYCDDQIDGQELGFGMQSPEPDEQARILERLIAQTESAMAGEPTDDPVFSAFQRVFLASGMDRRYPLELLEGFAMDVARHEYLTFEDTLVYCYHVAGVVGAMMATIMGVTDQPTLNRAIDLGIAFQLTNISRDVMEDAEDARIYLPRDWLVEAGAPVDAADFPGQEGRIYPVVERMLTEADRYYDSAVHGINRLPFRCAWAIAAARKVYGAIGEEVRRQGPHAWENRAGTSTLQKLGMLFSSSFSAMRASLGGSGDGPPRTGLWTAPPAT